MAMKRPRPVRAGREKPCSVCHRPTVAYIYCDRCRRLVLRVSGKRAMRKALQDGWNEALGRFICYWTGIQLEEVDWKSPQYLSYDHLTSGVKEPQKVCTYWVNTMKSSLSEEEFRIFIRELARFFRGEGRFRKGKLRFKHWFMAPRPRKAD
ncbi:MAG: hypothetical protein FJ149_11755 [Euryarchaeota archaeon]|nr:hypothetical protein [Euryarchaeota archaeon]